jgi:DNA segregation ATPase FtsK/SpoIIIE, S-DNA-T family
MSLLRRSTRPGVGESLPVRGPRWWEQIRWTVVVVAWVCRRTGRACRWAVRHWGATATAVAVVGLWWVMSVVGRGLVFFVLGGCLFSAWAFAMFSDTTLERRAWGRAHAAWRYLTLYRREWQPAMLLSGLAHGSGARQRLPRIVRVRVDGPADVVHVVMLPGQIAEDWHARRERLAHVFGARSCRVYEHGPRSRRLVLEFVVAGRVQGPAAGEGW